MPGSLPQATFQPRRRAASAKRRVALAVGAVAWVVALVVLASVVKHGDSVEAALIAVSASIVFGLALSSLLRIARLRRERAG